jgi:hypothetical protein
LSAGGAANTPWLYKRIDNPIVDSFREENKNSPKLFLEKHSGFNSADFEKDRIKTNLLTCMDVQVKKFVLHPHENFVYFLCY